MIRRPPRSTRTDTLLPYTTLFRSIVSHWGQGLSRRIPPETVFNRATFAESALLECPLRVGLRRSKQPWRSEEHTSELQSLMRISYAVFCLKKKTNKTKSTPLTTYIQRQNTNSATSNSIIAYL